MRNVFKSNCETHLLSVSLGSTGARSPLVLRAVKIARFPFLRGLPGSSRAAVGRRQARLKTRHVSRHKGTKQNPGPEGKPFSLKGQRRGFRKQNDLFYVLTLFLKCSLGMQ